MEGDDPRRRRRGAVQVALFPNEGICVVVQFLHVAADGRSFKHFMKSWASIHMSEGDPACADLEDSSPFHDREVVKDQNGLKPILLKDWWDCVGSSPSPSPREVLLTMHEIPYQAGLPAPRFKLK